MKRIADKCARIEGYKLTIEPADFFNDRQYRPDLEWLILGYLTAALSATGRQAPEFAVKLDPPLPDFQTYLPSGFPFRQVEITEVLRPDYQRGKIYSDRAKRRQRSYSIPDPHPQPWRSFREVLRSKLAKPYATDSWLLIYHNMWSFDFPVSIPWHERIFAELRSWTHDSDTTCDITQSRYESIYVVNSGGEAAVRLHPQWDIIRESP